MLKQRILTALVLLAVLLPTLFYRQPQPFFAIALIFIVAAGWEWARMNGWAGAAAIGTGALCALVCALMWLQAWPQQALPRVWQITGASWVLVGGWLLAQGVARWAGHARLIRLLLGLTALCLTWLAVVQARLVGVNFLLSVLALVWTADIAAYFAGRALGGRFSRSKLAASISPGKSWEGVWGGMVGVVALAFGWRYADQALSASVPSLYTHLGDRGGLFMVIAVIFMSAMSVVGDLIESLVKRSAGVKDSSGLLPGHGGVLDRIDALLPTLPLAMMLYAN